MTHNEVLQQIFTEDIARCIMRFHSHPVADMLKGLINEWKYFRMLSVRRLLGFNHYCSNKRTLKRAKREQLYINNCLDRGCLQAHLTHVPWNIRHPGNCQCCFVCRSMNNGFVPRRQQDDDHIPEVEDPED